LSEEMTFEQAEAALTSAAQSDAAEPASTIPASSSEGQSQGTTEPTQPDSFTSLDPNTLPPEAQEAYKRMQGDYTRKTQEVAELRRIQTELGDSFDPQRVTQSLQFVEALETDPEFAKAVYGQLNDVLSQAGLLDEATGEIDPAAAEALFEEDGDSALAREVEELKAWKQEQEEAHMEQALAAHIQRQDMAIRQEHPDWKDDDYDAVYQLAFAHGGDLTAAAETYESLTNRFISQYVERKAGVPSGVHATTSGGHAAVPAEGFASLDDAHRAAVEHVRNALG